MEVDQLEEVTQDEVKKSTKRKRSTPNPKLKNKKATVCTPFMRKRRIFSNFEHRSRRSLLISGILKIILLNRLHLITQQVQLIKH